MRFKLLVAAELLLLAIHVQAQTPPAPPRSVADILAVLDQYKPDQDVFQKMRARAEMPPPDTKHEQELAIFYHKRARANEHMGRFAQQREDLYKARKLALESGLPDSEGDGESNRILVDISVAEIFGGNWLRAIEVSKLLRLNSNAAYGLIGYTTLVQAYSELGDVQSAKEAMIGAENSLSNLKRVRDWARWGKGWNSLANGARAAILEAEGNYAEAERARRSVLPDVVYYVDLGLKYKGLDSRVDRALGKAMLVWAMSESLLSRNLRRQGSGAEAESYSRSSLLHMLGALGRFSPYTAGAITEVGWATFELGRASDAASLAKSAIETFEKSGTPSESLLFAEARSLYGSSLAALGRWHDASAEFEARDRALAAEPAQYVIKNGDNPDWAIALLRTGDVKKSVAMLDRLYRKRLSSGLSESEYFTAQIRGFYAMALAADGQQDKALAEFRGAIPALLDDARRNGGGEQGGAVARQMRLVWILEAYMTLLVDLRDSPLLRTVGIDAAAEVFRIADVARGSAVQRALAESAARATPSDPALAALARSEQEAQQRFGTLSDLLNRLLAAPPEQQLPKVIAELRRDIEALRSERDRLKQELDKRFPDYAELISPKPTTIGEVQAALNTEEALISIYLGAERSYVWAVPKTGKAAFAEVARDAASVSRQVASLRKALEVGDADVAAFPRFDLAQSHELYRALLQPVEAGWRDAKNLIVVPHKTLGQLPFAVLTIAPTTAAPTTATTGMFAEYRQAPWLIRRAAITQLPSVSTLLALRRMPAAQSGRKEFIGFGDPLFSTGMALTANDTTNTRRRLRNLAITNVAAAPPAPNAMPVPVPSATVANSAGLAQLSRLPDTAEEITSIARVLKADAASDVFLGKAASEKNVKSGQLDNRRIVMFATHGLVPGDLNGLTQPALALSAPEVTGNANEDGLLTMEEVLGLKLNADWVVLSACNTASGDGAGSEAVSGLGKAFFFAGARTLLVSNWPVETVSAKLLTTRLFEHQAENPAVTRAGALRATMLGLMDNATAPDLIEGKPYTYAHPMFWAPFSLVGDGAR